MTLKRLDRLRLDNTVPKPWLICSARNEIALMPHFLHHHRCLGVRQFIIIDNNSDDGMTEYLLAQPDVILYFSTEGYRQSNFGVNWMNNVIQDLGYEGWLAYADADEHLVYQDMESRSIQDLCAKAESSRFDTFFTLMIDMYSESESWNISLPAEGRITDVIGWFDTDYVFRRWPRRPWDPKPRGFPLQILGGPRVRLFSNLDREVRNGAISYTIRNQVDRFIDFVPSRFIPYLAKAWPTELPSLQKMAINYVRPGFHYINSHCGSNLKNADELVGLLHFKFCQELDARMKTVSAEGHHYRRGLHYIQLRQALQRWGSKSLMYRGSRRFQSSKDLVEAGLVGSYVPRLWCEGGIDQIRTGQPLVVT
jgi:hypothetical protein